MDRQKVTAYIKDDNLRIKMYRVVDLCNGVLKNHDIRNTEFLNPFEIKNAVSIINSESDLKYEILGGYKDCERAIIRIFPFYYETDVNDENLKFIQADGNFKFTSITHRDYLGSILGLGIKREKIGDILVHENFCQIIVDKEISDYILYNYTKVAHNNIKVHEISKEELVIPQQIMKDKLLSVSSLRLDNIIAGVFNMSRQEADRCINSEYVNVDYENVNQTSRQIKEGTLISVRKKGKFLVKEIGGISKKGKIRIIVSIYM
ncbi:RNA-binding protein [Peptostreptococcus canis]|uniref:RNA-binding protein n=1 Tax=Peptostreptococcus canis TaxID=1159213 RepID=A0ABR6TKF3_9FIRM|nr:YlmH/Sll1252 family protein [Peptostreptococcus canis]MBC2575885.1 RNA-binding protein [Peptostreptococcus canis]MBP1997994.1 RNA-binding protein YlmH [Peptostreptococcus canis]